MHSGQLCTRLCLRSDAERVQLFYLRGYNKPWLDKSGRRVPITALQMYSFHTSASRDNNLACVYNLQSSSLPFSPLFLISNSKSHHPAPKSPISPAEILPSLRWRH